MKSRIFVTLLLLVIAGGLLFTFNQVIVPEVGTDLAIAQVTEDASGAGVRATDGLTNLVNDWTPWLTGLIIIAVWLAPLKELWKKFYQY